MPRMYNVYANDFIRVHISLGSVDKTNNRTSYINIHFSKKFIHATILFYKNSLFFGLTFFSHYYDCCCCCRHRCAFVAITTDDKKNVFSRRNEIWTHRIFEWTIFFFFFFISSTMTVFFFLIMLKLFFPLSRLLRITREREWEKEIKNELCMYEHDKPHSRLTVQKVVGAAIGCYI